MESKSDAPKKAPAARPATAPTFSATSEVDVEAGKDNNRGGSRAGRGEGRGDGRSRGEGRGAGRGAGRGEGGERRERKPRDSEAAGEGATRARRDKDRRTTAGPGGRQSKDGAGAGGWGSEKGEALQAEKDPSSADVVADEDAAPEVEVPVVEVVPEPPTFTLDQFAAKREADRARMLALIGDSVKPVKVRKITSDFAGMTTSENKLGDLLVLKGAEKKAKESTKVQRSEDKKKVVELSFKFNPDPQVIADREDRPPRRDGDREGGHGGRREGRGEGRGDREGGRGGRGGRGRDERPQSSGSPRPQRSSGAVNINDQNAFPTL